MKTLTRQELPDDYIYYRTGSQVFYEYYREFTSMTLSIIEGKYGFMKAGKIGKLPFWSVIVEKIDREPTCSLLAKQGIEHGIIFWTPRRLQKKPKWWIRLPAFLTKELIHSSRSAFIRIDDSPEYWKKWSSKARGHRNKIHTLFASGTLRIESVDPKHFLDIYESLSLHDPNHAYLIRWCRRAFSLPMIRTKLRIYLWYADNEVVAWAVFIDEDTTSEYFTSFYLDASRPYHMGVALLDRWMSDSQRLGIKYCDLDHMWDHGNPSSQKWYTTFKESIAEFDIFFHDMWVRIF